RYAVLSERNALISAPVMSAACAELMRPTRPVATTIAPAKVRIMISSFVRTVPILHLPDASFRPVLEESYHKSWIYSTRRRRPVLATTIFSRVASRRRGTTENESPVDAAPRNVDCRRCYRARGITMNLLLDFIRAIAIGSTGLLLAS